MKKRLLSIFPIFFTLLFILSSLASAHPGATDEQGGHYDRSTGEYHFHHGYPAHQHVGGTCPYDFDNKTGGSSGGSSSDDIQTPSSPTVPYTESTTGMETTRAPSLDQPYVQTPSKQTTQKSFFSRYAEWLYGAELIAIIILLIWLIIYQRRKKR